MALGGTMSQSFLCALRFGHRSSDKRASKVISQTQTPGPSTQAGWLMAGDMCESMVSSELVCGTVSRDSDRAAQTLYRVEEQIETGMVSQTPLPPGTL